MILDQANGDKVGSGGLGNSKIVGEEVGGNEVAAMRRGVSERSMLPERVLLFWWHCPHTVMSRLTAFRMFRIISYAHKDIPRRYLFLGGLVRKEGDFVPRDDVSW